MSDGDDILSHMIDGGRTGAKCAPEDNELLKEFKRARVRGFVLQQPPYDEGEDHEI